MVFDASPVLDLVYSTNKGVKIKEALKNERLSATISEVNLVETLYILCRRLGLRETYSRMDALLESGYISVHPTSKLIRTSTEYKCERKLSLADCFAIALGKEMKSPVLFSTKESELVREMSERPFDVEIVFLEDIV